MIAWSKRESNENRSIINVFRESTCPIKNWSEINMLRGLYACHKMSQVLIYVID